MLNIGNYLEFSAKLKKAFSNVDKVSVIFNVENKNYKLIDDYFKEIINILSKESSMLSVFIDNKVEHVNNILKIFVDNVAELKKLEEYKLKIEEYFNRIGFGNLNIEVFVDEEESLKIQKEIENSKIDGSNVDVSILKQEPAAEENKPTWKRNYTPKRIETVIY